MLQGAVVKVEPQPRQPALARLHERAFAAGASLEQEVALDDRADRRRRLLEHGFHGLAAAYTRDQQGIGMRNPCGFCPVWSPSSIFWPSTTKRVVDSEKSATASDSGPPRLGSAVRSAPISPAKAISATATARPPSLRS